VGTVRLACIAVLLSASAQAQPSNYRFGAAQDRVVSDEPHGYTQHITPDFEVQDGIAVTYVRIGHTRVARLIATDYAAKVYTDVAPLDRADGKITAGDAWISQQAGNGELSLTVTPTAVDRLLLSGARRILYESVPTTVYFAHDHLDSLTVETDDQGAVVGRRAYAIFGADRASSGDGDSYGFTGQRQDDSGTVHFSFRQLDPATGRWSSADPLFHVATPDSLDAFGEATTAYAYVANNPSNYLDPTGTQLGRLMARLLRSVRNMDERTAMHVWDFATQLAQRLYRDHLNRQNQPLGQALQPPAQGIDRMRIQFGNNEARGQLLPRAAVVAAVVALAFAVRAVQARRVAAVRSAAERAAAARARDLRLIERARANPQDQNLRQRVEDRFGDGHP
jgi:RHS repeat-associated protein